MAKGAISRLEGFKEAREALQALSRSVQRGALKRSLNAPADLLVKRLKERTPVSDDPYNKTPGSLRDGTKRVPARARKGTPRVAVVIEDIAAVPIEFGTSKMEAKPYVRDTTDNSRTAMAEVLGEAAKAEIDQAAERSAKRALKG